MIVLQVVADKPFVVVSATHYRDSPPQELPEQLQLAALELRVWQVRRSRLTDHRLLLFAALSNESSGALCLAIR